MGDVFLTRNRSMDNKKATRQEEEVKTLEKFIKNKSLFQPNLVRYFGVHPEVREPCDMSYEGVEYQITYGDRGKLESLRETESSGKRYLEIFPPLPKEDYAEVLLERALTDKRFKSDSEMTLLVDCTYGNTGYSLPEREVVCKKYFDENKETLGGLWEHIFVVFPDRNVQLR